MGIRSWLTADKAMHFMACALIAALAGSLLPWWAGAVVALGIGIVKELVWDMWMRRGTASWGDLAADVLGIPVGIMIALL